MALIIHRKGDECADNHAFAPSLVPVKRKHIAQNREIIKTNALAQMRTRELENRIHDLEGTNASLASENAGLQARLEQNDYQIQCFAVGWKVMSQGLPQDMLAQAIDGDWRKFLPTPVHSLPSSRVSLKNSRLPHGVARPVARPPAKQLHDLREETTFGGSHGNQTDFHGLGLWRSSQHDQQHHLLVPGHGSPEDEEHTPRIGSNEALSSGQPASPVTGMLDA